MTTTLARRTLALVLALAALSSLHAAGTREPEIPPGLTTYEGLAAAISDGADIVIYDVRSAEETESGVIPGAINVPHTEIAEALPRSLRREVIVVYCASGGRSRAAYDALVAKKFKYVFDFGGIGNWQGALSQN